MPSALAHPGVYIEEIPSGVRTITGVATSITAFVGRAATGPVNEPVTIFSFGDFERRFGGLGINYPMSYAVADFFRNGGGQAVIVRLFKAAEIETKKGGLAVDKLMLKAVSPGSWFKGVSVIVDKIKREKTPAGQEQPNSLADSVEERLGLPVTDLFNLAIIVRDADGRVIAREQFVNLTIKDVPTGAARAQRIDRVLEQSQFVRAAAPTENSAVPAEGEYPKKKTTDAEEDPPEPTAAEVAAAAEAAAALAAAEDSSELVDADYFGNEAAKTGLRALDKVDLFNLLCIPPDKRDGSTTSPVYASALDYCVARRAMLVVDPPQPFDPGKPIEELSKLALSGDKTRNAAIYFPRLTAADPLSKGQIDTFVPCGAIAGIMAATDVTRGVWKAPAGLDAGLNGITGLSVKLTDKENGTLNQLGINCLRNFPVYGNVVWGARTLRGADQMADEYKYIPVRRLALFIEESLFRGTQWAVFEPNDEPLWAQIRLNIGAFMHNLFVKGAFQGQTPASAYFVKCDKDTTTQNDINLGVVNVVVGFAPLKPAEFVVIKIQQIAGNVLT